MQSLLLNIFWIVHCKNTKCHRWHCVNILIIQLDSHYDSDSSVSLLKDTEDLNIIMDLTDYWREQLTALMSQLKKTEHAQSEQISAIKQGIAKWLTVCTTQSK